MSQSVGFGIKRRDLLKSALAAAAAPYVITSTALGNEKVAAASERVTLGHIGLGVRGGFLLKQALAVPDRHTQSVIMTDCYQERLDKGVALSGAKPCHDFRDILARSDVDAVIIATPDHWHVPIALMAVNAGKHCYVEKPLGLTLEQDILCQKAFRAKHKVFQYGTIQRQAEHCKFGRELVRSGKLGQMKAIEVKAPNGGTGGSTVEVPVPEGFDYEMWIGPSPVKPYTVDRCWQSPKVKGTFWVYDHSIGYLGGWGAHPLDILVWCYDGDQAGPFTVEGTGKIPTEGLYDTVYDWNMTMQMADGVKITFTPEENSTKFIGTEGRLEITRGAIRSNPASLVPRKFPADDHAQDSGNHVEDFAAAVRSGTDPASNIEDAVRSDVLSQLCDIAVRTGRKITWDPKQMTIVGDEEAKKMMSRPLRAPWKLEI